MVPAPLADGLEAPMDKVSFGHEQVEPAEKTRRVRSVFTSRLALRPDERPHVRRPAPALEHAFVPPGAALPGEKILDMAGGTGDVAFRLARRGAEVTVADINPDMLAVGIDRDRAAASTCMVWAEEAEPVVPERSFDAFTIAFGIRNVTHIDRSPRTFRVLDRRALLPPRILPDPLAGLPRGLSPLRPTSIPPSGPRRRRRPKLPLPGRIDRALSRHGRLRRDDRESRLPPGQAEPILGGLVAIHSGWKV